MKTRLLFLIAALALAGCRSDAPPAQTLRVGVPSLPPSGGDPFRAEGTPSSYTWSAIFDGLTALAPDGTIQPALATAWSSEDGQTWRFVLRRGVRFSNGAQFDSKAAAATLRWLQSPEGKASVIGGRMRDVVAVETPAPDLLIVRLRAPDAVFPKRLPSVAMVEPGAWKRLGAAGFSKTPVGTGPYRLVENDERARTLVLDANPYAWRKPKVANLRLLELTDEAVRQQALISGDIDIARVGLDDTDLLEARGVKIAHAPSMQVMSIAFITQGRTGPLNDVRVRQALNYAVDKEGVSRALLRGLGAAAGQPGSKTTVGYNGAVTPYPHDPARARALLKAAGYGEGFPLKIEVVIGSLPADSLIYQSMAKDLEKVGVPVNLRAVSFPVFLRRYLSNDWGETNAFGLSWNAAPYNDVQRPMENFSCLKKPKPFFCDKALAEEIKAAGRILSPQARGEALDALAVRHHDIAPALFLVEQVDVIGYGPRVSGLTVANRNPVYEAMSLKAR
ncbi:MAG: ABC transporter substrate-binding protein [Pseudomonadota bacterium]|uniref:ABC transporter substrate-binding protein n=1 Tax=Phenylobacterium sp. TaxID=1871053 RepID=UPI0025ED6B0A|nr:ABC transporter substrate-binding protein [Phenylobacterium sp.]MBT9470537.1 ABC transporter substrate-binding protein [Phenylobacterium sp.]